jgi:competence protein ComEA
VENPYPWRALEDPPEPGAGVPVASSAPSSGHGTGRGTALGRDDVRLARRHLVAMVVLAVGVLAALAVVVVVVVGPAGGSTVLLTDQTASAVAVGTPASSNPGRALAGASPRGAESGAMLVVDVAGAVLRPGVYRLPVGARVVDAVAAAGGYGPRVDVAAASRVNLAAPLTDGAQVRIPSRDDATAGAAAPSGGSGSSPGGTGAKPSDAASTRPIDLNTASAEELDTLPGVGPATAAKIIAAREKARFAKVDDLRGRGVVGEATFRKLQGLVTVRP